MSLKAICAGWSRTGTYSLRLALNELGCGPCYHMQDVFLHPEHHALWRAAAAGKLESWDALFQGYGSVADTPPCLFWRELVAAYPGAKVVLTLREPSEWYESMRATVYEAIRAPERIPGLHPSDRAAFELARELVLEGFFKGRFEDRDHALALFEEHNRAVQQEVPAERLLVYQVAQGWQPLCHFLGVPAPSSEFPNTNKRQDFRRSIGLSD